MNRKDIELYGMIQQQMKTYCDTVLELLIKDYPTIGISEFSRIVSIDVVKDYINLTYSSNSHNRSIKIPIEFVVNEDAIGFCKYYSDIIKKYGKKLTKSELEELVLRRHWDVFNKLFYNPFPPENQRDIERAHSKLQGMIEAMTFVLTMCKDRNEDDSSFDIFTEKDYFFYSSILIQFLDWAKKDDYWSQRVCYNKEICKDIKADFIVGQEEIIKLIKESENHTEGELSLAEKALEDIKKL